MRLFSNRSQMTAKCGKSKKLAHEEIAEYVNDVLTTFWLLLWSITEQTLRNVESFSFIWRQNKYKFFISNSFSESRPLPRLANTKKAIWRNQLSIQNELKRSNAENEVNFHSGHVHQGIQNSTDSLMQLLRFYWLSYSYFVSRPEHECSESV